MTAPVVRVSRLVPTFTAMEADKHYLVSASISGAAYRTQVSMRGHGVIADEPIEDGGANAGPKPHELICAALASCTAITLRMYVDRKRWEVGEIHVDVRLDRTVTNGIVNAAFRMSVRTDRELSEEQRARMLLVAGKCPVHKTLQSPIAITTELA
jgi:putative redox protein